MVSFQTDGCQAAVQQQTIEKGALQMLAMGACKGGQNQALNPAEIVAIRGLIRGAAPEKTSGQKAHHPQRGHRPPTGLPPPAG
jgi:hypothetical protein